MQSTRNTVSSPGRSTETLQTDLHSSDQHVLVAGVQQLRLHRLHREPTGTPLLLLPGLGETARVFLNPEGDGLAHQLARAGYDVFIGEWRGKGGSWPHTSRHSRHDLHDLFHDDLPALAGAIGKRRGNAPQVWLGRDLAGLAMLATLARGPALKAPLLGLCHWNAAAGALAGSAGLLAGWRRWRHELPAMVAGYLPGLGERGNRGQESLPVWRNAWRWWRERDWRDPRDGYALLPSLLERGLPPSLYLQAAEHWRAPAPGAMRQWVQRLGEHDGRAMVFPTRGWHLAGRRRAVQPAMTEALLDWLTDIGAISALIPPPPGLLAGAGR